MQVKTKSRLGQELVIMQRTISESRTESHDLVAIVSLLTIVVIIGVNANLNANLSGNSADNSQ